MTYSPFKTALISELTASDLAVLADIPEGWFIEYKREPCKAKDYAKEASAFANSMGGWIFVGLQEDSSTRKPAGGPGLSAAEATKLQDAARDAITQNLSPTPKFEVAIISGPIPDLSIPDDKCVLVIYLPESQNTPHIHCSGKIYRRQADKSDPLEVTDRAELDTLYKRTKRLKDFTDRRLNQGFDRKWADSFDTPWLHCALTPDPTQLQRLRSMTLSKFREIILSETERSIRLPDVYSSALGFVARNHRDQAVPHGAALTLECGVDGSIYITIPLSSISVEVALREKDFLNNKNGRKFTDLLKKNSFGNVRVIDCTFITTSLLGMHTHIQRILAEVGANSRYLARIHMKNIFRCVPFFESETYLNVCSEHSIPVMHHSQFIVPPEARHWLIVDDIFERNALLSCITQVLFSMGLGEDNMPAIVSEAIMAGHERNVNNQTAPKR